jgi:uncharacterized membrane protein
MKGEANLSRVDRAVRVIAGIALLAIGVFAVRGLPGFLLDLAGTVLVFSGAIGFCHIYKVLGICSVKKT